MEESKERFQFSYELPSLAVFISALVLSAIYGETSFDLTEIQRLYISQATLDGVDISKRVNLFYRATLFFGALTASLVYAFSKLRTKWELNKYELSLIGVPSLVGVFLLMADSIGKESPIGVKWASGILVFNLLIIFLNRKIWRLDTRVIATNIASSLMIALPLYVGFTFLAFTEAPNPNLSLLTYFIGVFISFGLLYFGSANGLSNQRILTLARPIIWLPVFIFFSIELFFLFKFRFDQSFLPKSIFLVLILTSILAGLRRYRFGKILEISDARLNRAFGLSALFAFLLFTIYFPIISAPQELFELANPANGQMRMFEFGELPLIDFMNSHMLSELVPGFIYHLIHGYKGSLDFLVYEPLYLAASLSIAFFWGIRVLGSTWASLLFLIAFPYLHSIYPTHLFYCLLAFAATHYLLERPIPFRMLILGITWITLIVWRLDAGVAALFGGFFYLLIQLYLNKTQIKPIAGLKGISMLIGFLGIALAFAMIVRSPEYILQNFKTALHYVSGSQAHGYSLLAVNFDHQFYLLHLILPVLGVLAVIGIPIYLRRNKGVLCRQAEYALNSALFFYLIFLANFPRGIVRHGFFEGHDKYLASSFYLATALVLIGFANSKSSAKRFSLFFAGSIFTLLLIKVLPLSQSPSEIDKFFSKPSVFAHNFIGFSEDKASRVINDSEGVADRNALKSYLSDELAEDQTFMDFSNAPMLYFYSAKRVPSYFCQNLQNSIDDYTQIQHIKQLEAEDVPLVVYSHIPALWYDATDGVPNAMRYYLIAEYIYQNYQPADRVGGRSIWKSKSNLKSGLLDSLYIDELSRQLHDYRQGAIHLFNYSKSEPQGLGISIPLKKSAISNAVWDFSGEIPKESGSFIQLELNVESEKQVSFEIFGDRGLIGKITFTARPEQSQYLIRTSNFYGWFNSRPLSIRFNDLDSLEILSLSVLPDERYEY